MSDDDDFVETPPSSEQAGPSSTQQAAPSPASTGLTDTPELTFRLGDQFSSFAELEKKVTTYSSAHFVQLWKRDARTIEAAKKRVGKIASKMSDVLKYHSVKYCCVHGGKKFATKASTRTSS
ncbi:hypothetical protein HPB48_021550 [Haemaphysalis longicornis]|uniref:ZSWIM3 N-terminal domain-containing protein n=1 Tax=Haemaphysalis longicornis TaxID=44386 RepID=A0A9J6GBP0_HAELO|nr:hypothetical protein HPB48_021550 [Haemaphysalis longicornis]